MVLINTVGRHRKGENKFENMKRKIPKAFFFRFHSLPFYNHRFLAKHMIQQAGVGKVENKERKRRKGCNVSRGRNFFLFQSH